MPDVPENVPKPDVPNIVLKRLQRQSPAPADWHPDADLLTAFTERSLTSHEREQVMSHLADCGDCREVLEVALPAFEADVTPVTITASRRGWLSWPTLRWGVVAAGLALITSVGILQYGHHSENPNLAAKLVLQNEAPATQKFSSSAHPAPPQLNSAQPEMRKKADVKAPPNAEARVPADRSHASNGFVAQRAVHAKPSGAAGGIIGGAVGSESSQSSSDGGANSVHGAAVYAPGGSAAVPEAMAKQNAPAAPHRMDAPPASQMVEVQAQSAQATAAEPGKTQDNLTQTQPERPLTARALENFNVVGKAKDPVPVGAGSPSAPVSAPPAIPLQTSPALMLRASPRWNITPAGALQRSLNAGKTWEDVSVNWVSLNDTPQAQAAYGAARATSADKKLQEATVLPTPAVVFRAVAAIGPEVWAGGSPCALYHSVDSGAHWKQVLPSSADVALTGDITQIEFLDPQHGRVTTSSRELWITADSGQTWRKQQ
jgi:hypothetical protein